MKQSTIRSFQFSCFYVALTQIRDLFKVRNPDWTTTGIHVNFTLLAKRDRLIRKFTSKSKISQKIRKFWDPDCLFAVSKMRLNNQKSACYLAFRCLLQTGKKNHKNLGLWLVNLVLLKSEQTCDFIPKCEILVRPTHVSTKMKDPHWHIPTWERDVKIFKIHL